MSKKCYAVRPMLNIKLIIAYFGAAYMGWQKTKLGASIEEALEQALAKILQQEVKLQAASRTDAGVHASGQVVNFRLHKPFNLRALQGSLNGLLPKDIAVVSIEEMAQDFHPTLDTVKKEYAYQICNCRTQLPFHRQTSWHFPYPVDIEEMRRGSVHLLGRHDFSTFCNDLKSWDRNPICQLEKIEILEITSNRFEVTMTADHFLYRMARNIAGTLAYVGCGKLDSDKLPQILKNKDRRAAGITAPSHGLTLKRVFY
jgi:tRNA pseudouridine38-40 synthase